MAEKIQLQAAYSRLNESLTKLFDESGVRRTFTVPYVDGHSADKLRTTIIPKGDENAKAAISAARVYLDGIEQLVGEKDQTVRTAKGQLALVAKTNGQGMNLQDFGVMMIQLTHGPTQAVAKAYSKVHPDGAAPHMRAPKQQQQAPEGQEPAQGATQTAEGAPPEAQTTAQLASAAPVAQPAPTGR